MDVKTIKKYDIARVSRGFLDWRQLPSTGSEMGNDYRGSLLGLDRFRERAERFPELGEPHWIRNRET